MDITNIQDITTVPESQESLEYVVYTLYHIRIQVTGKVSKNEKKRTPRSTPSIIPSLFSRCIIYNLFAFVVAASRAYMMRHHCFVALRAFYKTRSSQLPVCATHFLTSLGQSVLWYCHVLHLLKIMVRIGVL